MVNINHDQNNAWAGRAFSAPEHPHPDAEKRSASQSPRPYFAAVRNYGVPKSPLKTEGLPQLESKTQKKTASRLAKIQLAINFYICLFFNDRNSKN